MKYLLYFYSYCKAYFQPIKMLKFFFIHCEIFFAVNFTGYLVIYEEEKHLYCKIRLIRFVKKWQSKILKAKVRSLSFHRSFLPFRSYF